MLLQYSGGSWNEYWIRDNLPPNINGFAKALEIITIAGDGHSKSIVYVGTEAGVFRGAFNAQSYERWTPYNEGLPVIKITDLLVDASKKLCAATHGRGAWAVISLIAYISARSYSIFIVLAISLSISPRIEQS